MQIIMYLGLGIAVVGLFLLIITTKWVNGWFVNYVTTNRPLALLGWLLLLIGVVVFLLPPFLGGAWK
ncbi:hypothetical protein ACRYI5_00475 [Furfurilactobacillus sp. WILCCON 0119]